MNDKPKSKWSWRLLRWSLIGLAVLVTLVAALVTEENWRGKHAWESYQCAAAARGERLDMGLVNPPPMPDDQNFFAAPIVAEIFNFKSNQFGVSSAPAVASRSDFNIYLGDSRSWPTNDGVWQRGKLADLKQWQQYFRDYAASPAGRTNAFPVATQPQTPAADVLLALSVFDPALAELRRAGERPGSRLPLHYERGFEAFETGDLLPCLAAEKRCSRFLQLRTLAELEAGQSGPALADLKLSWRLTDSLRNQPFLISHLVGIAMMTISFQPVYEGLAQHLWNDAQLDELETALATQDFLGDFQLAMRGERTCAIEWIDTQRLTRQMRSFGGESGTEFVTNSLFFVPPAYFYQNELAFARLYDQYVLPLVDVTNQLAFPAAYRASERGFADLTNHFSPYTILTRMVSLSASRTVVGFASSQTHVNLARVACALERYRLAHGEYPETLDALSPRFIATLPHDLINGQPLHYRRTADGLFVLYSVGWNEKDDGGVVVLTKHGSVDQNQGDWVWKYPAKNGSASNP